MPYKENTERVNLDVSIPRGQYAVCLVLCCEKCGLLETITIHSYISDAMRVARERGWNGSSRQAWVHKDCNA